MYLLIGRLLAAIALGLMCAAPASAAGNGAPYFQTETLDTPPIWRNQNGVCSANGASPVICSGTIRQRLTGPASYYVDDINGLDTNLCTSATTGACKTLNGVVAKIAPIDLNGFALTVNVAAPASSYAGMACLAPWTGLGTVTFTGNTGSPTSVLVSGGSLPAFDIENGCIVTLQGFSVQSSANQGVQAVLGARVNLGNMDFGPVGSGSQSQAYATRFGYLEFDATTTVHGGAGSASFVQASHGGQARFNPGSVTSWTADSSYNAGVMFADSGEIVGTTTTIGNGGHVITAYSVSLINYGEIQWNSHIPPISGDIPGSALGGYVYNVGGVDFGAVPFASFFGSPVLGTVQAISDGLAANCGDGTCTTFGTAITGGGGALKLLAWYNGSGWRLIGK